MRQGIWFVIVLAASMSGCTSLQYGGGRVLLLVFVPAVLIGLGLYLLRRGSRKKKTKGRGPRYPDFDDRE